MPSSTLSCVHTVASYGETAEHQTEEINPEIRPRPCERLLDNNDDKDDEEDDENSKDLYHEPAI